MNQINAVLFDMDGVLYAYDFENRLKLLESALDVPAETIRAKIFNSGFEDTYDDGQMTTDDYIDGISKHLGVDVTLRQWIAARKWAMAPEPAMIDLARDLGTRVEIALLTNNGPMLYENVAQMAPELPGVFGEHLFCSGVHGFNKERADGFVGLLEKMSWSAETTFFIDDSPTYIARADDAGLVTHHFVDEDVDGLKERLKALGLL